MKQKINSANQILAEIQAYVANFNEQTSAIEVDIVLEKTRRLYDTILSFKSAPISTESVVAKEPVEIVPEPEPIVEQVSEPVQESLIDDFAFTIESGFVSTPELQPETKSEQNQPKTGMDLATKLSKKPLSDIAAGMGINDKFLFRSTLFGNNQDLFVETIKILNESASLADAQAYISSHFDWNPDDATVQSFLLLVERRFL